MGTTDYIAKPAPPVELAASLTDSFEVHLPQLQLPDVEDLLEDRLAAIPTNRSLTGPVDIIPVTDERRHPSDD